MIIEHEHDNCIGYWRVHRPAQDGERSIRCDGCYRTYPGTSEVRLAAIDENYAGVHLERLTAEGVVQLAQERAGGGS